MTDPKIDLVGVQVLFSFNFGQCNAIDKKIIDLCKVYY